MPLAKEEEDGEGEGKGWTILGVEKGESLEQK